MTTISTDTDRATVIIPIKGKLYELPEDRLHEVDNFLDALTAYDHRIKRCHLDHIADVEYTEIP